MANGTWGGVGDRHPFLVKIMWLKGANTFQTGFHVRSNGGEIGDAEEIATEVADWVNDSFRTILINNQRITGIDVVDLVDRTGYLHSPENLYGSATTSVAQSLPSFVAAVISMKSDRRTRYGQGRMFWPVMDEGALDGDALSAASQASMQAVLNNLTERLTGDSLFGYRMINVHGALPPKAATATRPPRAALPPSWYDVESFRLNVNVTALRSRKAGVGS